MSVVVDLLNVSVRRCLFRLHGWSLQCPCYVTGKAVILFVFFLKAGNNITAHEEIYRMMLRYINRSTCNRARKRKEKKVHFLELLPCGVFLLLFCFVCLSFCFFPITSSKSIWLFRDAHTITCSMFHFQHNVQDVSLDNNDNNASPGTASHFLFAICCLQHSSTVRASHL